MSPDLLQYAHVCLGLARTELDTILQMCLTSDEQRGRIIFLILSRRLLAYFATKAH